MSEQQNKTPRQFINGVWLEEKVFDSGGSIIKLSVLPDKFIESLKSVKPNEKGYIRLVISRRKEVGKNNESHTMYVDDWKPTNSTQSPVPKNVPPKAKPVVKKAEPVAEKTEPTEQPPDNNDF